MNIEVHEVEKDKTETRWVSTLKKRKETTFVVAREAKLAHDY
jgi:hypothetical protein